MKSRLFLLIIFLGFGAVAIGWVYESNLRPTQEKTSLLFPDDIDYFLTNMRYRELNAAGELDFEFYTPRLEHYPLDDISNIELPSMQIVTDTGPWQVDAVTGEFRHQDNLLHLRQQVVMLKQGDAPMQVYTESISFAPDKQLVRADSEILMLNGQARIRAQSAEFDLAEKVYRFDQTLSVYRDEDK
jgi:LPS export ABC transporter protein LptC